uniref:beta-sandwich lipoprotein n=1 Tax=Streptococcus pluranimalium TaxID=82348 RepID=UPI003F691389
MKKKLLAVTVSLMAVLVLAGCDKSDKVSHNLSKEADNFNSTRQLTVINAIRGDTLFQMTGRMSIQADSSDNQLEVVVEEKKGKYKKHFIGLSDNVTYIVEDVTGKVTDPYNYTLNFNPKMTIPYKIKTVD